MNAQVADGPPILFDTSAWESRSWAPREASPSCHRVTLQTHAERLRQWLFARALPLWASQGLDQGAGGFHEALDQSGAPLRAPKRARVQARQAYVFATAGMLGWDGPWRDRAQRGLDQLNRAYRRPDGLFRTLVSPEGDPLDETARLYDQAFVLLAFARLSAAGVRPEEMESSAAHLRDLLQSFRNRAGGFRENSERPFQANAHMHLFEAAMEWSLVSPDPAWRALCEEIVDLALTRFVDDRLGVLGEVFDDQWRPAPGALGRLVEPGHQFEWAWLLNRWATLSGDLRARRVADRLRSAGLSGIGPDLGVALDEMIDGQPRSRAARLWPQTEWLKSALDAAVDDAGCAISAAACEAMVRYLDTPLKGLWWDRLLEDGRMQAEPAPASSFYHIVTACSVLFGAVAVPSPEMSAAEAVPVPRLDDRVAAAAPGN